MEGRRRRGEGVESIWEKGDEERRRSIWERGKAWGPCVGPRWRGDFGWPKLASARWSLASRMAWPSAPNAEPKRPSSQIPTAQPDPMSCNLQGPPPPPPPAGFQKREESIQFKRSRLPPRLRHPIQQKIYPSPPLLLQAPMAEEPSPFDEVPAYLLHEITRHIPCKVDRLRALVVNRSWRTSLQALPPPPLPPQLPWLLRPSAGGPNFSCLLSGADELSVHRVRVPADLRHARYFGSYDGGWLFLASRQTSGHMLFNIRTEQCLFLPDTVPRPWSSDDFPMIMLAATVSSPPSRGTDDPCIGAAIVHCTPFITDSRQITFWRMGSHMAIPSIPPDHQFDVVSNQFVVEEMEDVIYHKGAFHFVTKLKNVFVCRLALHQADLVVDHREWLMFAPQDDLGYPRPVATARYLVESREQLLMVLKCTCNLPGWPPLVFSVFEMTHVQAPAGAPQYVWTPVPTLVGRMLFVGHGCSRSYELANFPGFQEGIYFLDDLQFYSVSRIVQYQEYLCFDNGKYTLGPPHVVSRCFWPDQVNSNYSSPVWLLPGGEDDANNAQAQVDVHMM
uniref:KIB1-4 beta-propeller domain-containing protein n=2 Tax=Oryza TaxID=4527 RepID=A0A0E0HIN3_ORYNI